MKRRGTFGGARLPLARRVPLKRGLVALGGACVGLVDAATTFFSLSTTANPNIRLFLLTGCKLFVVKKIKDFLQNNKKINQHWIAHRRHK